MPCGEQGAVHVAIAGVKCRGRVLVGTRRDRPFAGHAEFPGGKCHPGELPERCVVRECREETGIDVAPCRVLDRVQTQIEGHPVVLWFFECVPVSSALGAADPPPARGNFRWLTVEELKLQRFPPANSRVLRMLLTGRGADERSA